jgi:DNA-binding NtrC family response regulator
VKGQKRPREVGAPGATSAPKLVLLVGEAPGWQPEIGALLGREGYATDRVAQLDAVLPLVATGAVQALFVAAGPLAASDLLLVRRIREVSPRTAIVVVTKSYTDPDLKRAFESGATAFLSWPASTDAVRHAIERGALLALAASRP